MCAVSAVTDYYRDKWIGPLIPSTLFPDPTFYPPMPAITLKPGVTITAEQWAEYQELKRRMEEYDAKTGQPDCIKPEVAEWEKVVESNIKEI